MTVTPLGAVARLEHALSNFEGEQEAYRHRLNDARKRLATYGARVGEAFAFDAELDLKRDGACGDRSRTRRDERRRQKRAGGAAARGVRRRKRTSSQSGRGGAADAQPTASRSRPRRARRALRRPAHACRAGLLAGSCAAPPALRAGGGLRKEDDEGPPEDAVRNPQMENIHETDNVDPRALKPNPDPTRRTAAAPQADALLLATIKAVGIVQPPIISPQQDGGNGYYIKTGIAASRRRSRRTWRRLQVLVVPCRDGGAMRRSSRIRARAAEPGRSVAFIERLVALGWTEESIAVALAQSVRQVRKLRLLANVLPAMLDQMAGRYADERSFGPLRRLARNRGGLEETQAEQGQSHGLVVTSRGR